MVREGDAKLCSVTSRSFLLRQLNCGKRGCMVALPFVLLAAASPPDMLSAYLVKTQTHTFFIGHITGQNYS